MSSANPDVGDTAPDFEAETEAGETVRLSDFRGLTVVLYFYPKDDTKGCTTQACGFRDHHQEFTSREAMVLGVSPDSAASHAKFRDKYDLPFTLLVDGDHAIAEAYGVWAEKKMYGRSYMGIVRSHFVIDPEGRIIEAHRKVRPADSPELALEALVGR